MLATALESIQSTESKRSAYTRWILVTLAVCVAVKAVWFSRWGIWHVRDLVDFDAFHLVAQHVWLGDVDQAYQFSKLVVMQKEASGGVDGFMPWTYPPQFSLLLAPLGLAPTGLAYFLFTALTLVLFLVVLRSIAGRQFPLFLVILFPAMEITLACGQNGFLTAALIGTFCLFIEERPALAGLALGLMVIKPHLAIAFALYSLLKRCWTAVMTAAFVVLASSALCTAIFGVRIWSALLQSVHDSSIFLDHGYYPLYRMISFYAALRTVGASSGAAFLGQSIVAIFALSIVVTAVGRKMPTRISLGLTALVSLCISPYAYDYDFLIFGIGLSIFLPELQLITHKRERGFVYAGLMLVGAYGSLRGASLGKSATDISYLDVTSIGGFVIVSIIALITTILLRRSKIATASALCLQ